MTNIKGELNSTNNKQVPTLTNNQLEIKCQLWPSKFNTINYKVIDSIQLIELLKQNTNNELYIKMRNHYKMYIETGDEQEKILYDRIKDKLNYLTFPVMLHPKRKTDCIRKFNNLVVLDVDFQDNPILLEDVHNLKHQISEDEMTYLLFLSPNGYGLKIVVVLKSPIEINNISDELRANNIKDTDRLYDIDKLKAYFSYAFNQVKQHFEESFNIIVDKSASSILGGTFLSADETPYLNPNSKLFDLSNIDFDSLFIINQHVIDKDKHYYTSNYEILDEIRIFIEKYNQGRHNCTMKITLQANYYNIPEYEIIDYCFSIYGAIDFTFEEVERIVRDFYGKPYYGKQFIIKELFFLMN